MGDPLTAAVVIGSSLQIVGQLQSAKTQSELLEREAEIRERRGAFAAGQQKKETEQLLSAQRTGFSKSGVTLEGTPLEVMMKTAEERELERQAILTGTAEEAGLSRREAKAVRRTGQLRAFGSLISGTGQVLRIKEQREG